MDLSLNEEERLFQHDVCTFLDEALRPEWRGISDHDPRPEPKTIRHWQAVLAAKGWLVPAWPLAHGGCGWTPMKHHIFKTECARLRAPKTPHVSLGMVGPLICAFGSPAQQAYYLPRIVSREDIWCQGFSEPGAGSDLAALKTTAKRDGNTYVVTGQKIWTTYAHDATRMLGLVRTDPNAPRPQAGISMLLIDMTSPGITVRPIQTIDGAHHFNEVFLDEVRVPVSRRLGEENKGWDYARFLLLHERSGIADIAATRGVIEEVAAIAAAEPCGSGTLLDDSSFSERLGRLEVRLEALEILELRMMDANERGQGGSYDASVLKILGTELKQAVFQMGIEALGPLASIDVDDDAPVHSSGAGRHLVTDALFYRAASIFGGTNEIQRNIVARALLKNDVEI